MPSKTILGTGHSIRFKEIVIACDFVGANEICCNRIPFSTPVVIEFAEFAESTLFAEPTEIVESIEVAESTD